MRCYYTVTQMMVKLIIQSKSKAVEHMALVHSWLGCNCYSHFGKLVYQYLLEPNMYLLCDPQIPLQDICLRNMHTYVP